MADSPAHPFHAPIVRFTKGPGMITLGALMLLGLAVLMGVLFALFPTPPPEASLAGPEAEARAMAVQSRAAAAMAGVCAVMDAPGDAMSGVRGQEPGVGKTPGLGFRS